MSGVAAATCAAGPLAGMADGFACVAQSPATNATMTMTFLRGGQIALTFNDNDLSTDRPRAWNVDASGNTVGDLWWIRCTVNSGVVTGSATSTWLQLSSNQGWTVGRSSPGTTSANVTFDFSTDGGTTVLGSVTGTIQARIV